MQRSNAWTLKALRALLACLCVFFALPAATSADPALRPVAVAMAAPSAVAAVGARVTAGKAAEATAPDHARAITVAASEAPSVARSPHGAAPRDGRRLYLEKRSLLR